jgi:transcription elongation factor Elf1
MVPCVDLSAAVDVYSDWVDACDAVAKEDVEDRGGEYAPSHSPAARRPSGGRARDEEDDEDDIIDDDEDGGGGYGGEGIVADDEY